MGLLSIKPAQPESRNGGDGLSIRPLAGASVKCGITESLLRRIVREEVLAAFEHQAKTQSWSLKLSQKLRRIFFNE